MKSKQFFLLLFILVAVSACSPVLNVSTDYDKQANFTKYKTFSFYKFTDKGPGISELNRNRIVNAVRAEMIAKGFTLDENNPDILVNATALLKEMKQVTGTNYYNYGGFYRPYYWGPGFGGTTTYSVNNYTDGSLVIDVIDASSKTLVWQGTGNKEIDVPLKNADTEITSAVKKILAGFPPK